MSEVRVSDSVTSPLEFTSGSPGAILRRCREYHGITLEEASETTKIGISHLKALEDDQIREFANQAYLKGFLRIYATYLGLNSEDIARMYDKLFGVKGEKTDNTRTSGTPARSSRRIVSFKKMVFPALLLVIILVTATFFRRPASPPFRQPDTTTIVMPPLQNSAIQMVQSSERVKVPKQDIQPVTREKRPAERPDSEKPMITKRPQEITKSFILKIKVTQNGTLTSSVDGSESQQQELAVGDVIEWKAEKKVTLELSNAGGVDVELNGKPYKPFGPSGKPIYVELDSDGVK